MNIAVNSRLAGEGYSGIPIFIRQLYSRLLEIDNDNEYFFFQTQHQPKLGKTVVTNGISTQLGIVAYENIFLPAQIARRGVNVLHGPAHTLPLIKSSKIKYLLTVHDVSFTKISAMGGLGFKMLYTQWLKRSLKVADIVVADSINTKMDLVNKFGISGEKITVIYLAADKAFVPSKKTIHNLRLMTVATHPKRKNIELLVKVFIKLVKKYPELTLRVVGELNRDCRQLLEEAKASDKVVHLINLTTDDLVSEYQQASVFVYPSLYEGFGLPVLEAMSCGIPALCSNNSSLPEVQHDDFQRFSAFDHVELLRKVDTLLSDSMLRKKLGQKNYRASKHFTWEKTAESYLQVFNTLCQ